MTPTAKPHPLVDALRAAIVEHLPTFAKARTDQTTAMLEQFEQDIAPHIAPIVDRLLADPATPDEFRSLLGAMTAPTHFGESIVIGIALGAIIAPVLNAALAPALQALTNTAWHGAATTPGNAGTIRPSPDLLATAVLKQVFATEGDAAPIAADNGVSAADFHTFVETAGSSSGVSDAFLLWRLGKIDKATFENMLAAVGIAGRFFGPIEELFTLPLSAAEAISANVKGWIDDTTTANYLQANGVDPTLQQTLKHAAGRPLTWLEVFSAIHRGYTGPITPEHALQQSDINDDYAPLLPFLQYKYPSLFQIVALLKDGGMTPARARTDLLYEGFDPVDVEAIVTGTKSTTTAKVHDITASQTLAMCRDRFITHAEATTRLTALGYSAADVTTYLGYADENRAIKLSNALISSVGSLYVAHKLDKTGATTALNGDAIPADVQADLFHVWDLERAAKVHVPTVANVVGAYRRGEITAADCKLRLQELGVQDGDLGIIVADGWPPTKEAEAKAAAAAVVAA